jgi:hypothetical protein
LRSPEYDLPDALVVEDVLDHDEPADQVAGLGRDDGDRRKKGIPQYVTA